MARFRWLGVLAALVTAVALLPSPPVVHAQAGSADPGDACPVEPQASGSSDRSAIPAAHRANVDCAAAFAIVKGFPDNTYRPGLPVRRDQMASFIALTLDAAGVALPPGEDDQFADVSASDAHADNINRLAAAGIVEGFWPNGVTHVDVFNEETGGIEAIYFPPSYGPALRTRRDQMASFVVRAAGYAFAGDVDFFDESVQQFTDVHPDSTHFEKVNAAAIHQLAGGVSTSRFNPGQQTRRDQMASFVVRLLTFLAVPTTVAVTAPETATVAGSAVATATVSNQFSQPVTGAEVEFTATGAVAPAMPPGPQTASTDAAGQATFGFTSTVPQNVTVTASIPNAAPAGNFTAQATSDSADTEFRAAVFTHSRSD